MSQTEHPKYFDCVWLQCDENFIICTYSENFSMYSLSKVTRELIICSQRDVDKLKRYLKCLSCQCSSFSSQSKGKKVVQSHKLIDSIFLAGKKSFFSTCLIFYVVIQYKISVQSDILILLKQYFKIYNPLVYHFKLKQIFNIVFSVRL